jgi:hypothetical protein
MRPSAAPISAALLFASLAGPAFAAPVDAPAPPAAEPKKDAPASGPKADGKKDAPEEPPKVAAGEPAEDPGTGFEGRFVLDNGRIAPKPIDPLSINFSIRGEYQLRYRGQSDLRLQAPIGHREANNLGQNQYLYHWLRLGARLQIRDFLAVVMQIDVPRGFIAGDSTQYVDASRDSFAAPKWYEVHPRYLYLEYSSPIGVFRLGQQGSYWGMGILANDGDHDTLFGDHRRGALVERLLYATTPLGKGTPLALVIGGDVVFQDNTANLLGGDRAFQGVAAILYRTKPAEIGFYGVVRRQTRSAQSVNQFTPFTEGLTVGVLDLTGRFDVPVAGTRAFAYGQMEAAVILGSTSFVRTNYTTPLDPTAKRDNEAVRSFGGAATLGAVRVAGEGKDRWGDIMGEIELGYASGDASPADGVTKRFSMDENHHVGLVLFDHVLRWKTARAATIAQDPSVVARAAPGLQLLSSNGGISGAQYLNPRFVIRPKHWLDLKGGVVIAQTTADFVDPYHFGALGNAANYDGGDPHRHDLGVELDVGVATRIKVDASATVQLGAEGGLLFPGHAFDDAAGRGLANQYLGTVQVGLQF